MKPLSSLFKKALRKLRRPKAPPVLSHPEPPRKVISSLEPLEGRIAPASLINPTTLMYKDLDGDIVKVSLSKSLFNKATSALNLAEANLVFQFNSGTVDSTTFNAATAAPEQLQLIDLTKAPMAGAVNLANGTGITITAVKGSLMVNNQTTPGDGFANVGYINASSLGLGAVSIAGDLGRIDAGTANSPMAIASLKVQSIGVADKAVTQQATGASLTSNITGLIPSMTVVGDFNAGDFEVSNGSVIVNGQTKVTSPGSIASLTIGGSLKGLPAAATASDHSGFINVAGDLGTVKIGTLATQGIVGGGGTNAGALEAAGKIGSVTISGDITGGAGGGSGAILATGAAGSITVHGSVVGAGGANSGTIQTGSLSSVVIGHHLTGGSGSVSGSVNVNKTIGTVKIGTVATDGITGGSASNTGIVFGGTKIGSVTVIGDVTGQAGDTSGTITSNNLGPVSISHDLIGGGGMNSGSLQAGTGGSVTIGHNLTGGGKSGSGTLTSANAWGAILIGGDLDATQTGTATQAGGISAGLSIASVTVNGALKGGPNDHDGFIDAGTTLGAVTLHDLIGGNGTGAGAITSASKIASVTVKGNVTGGGGVNSGSVFSGLDFSHPGDIGAVKIGGKLTGGSMDNAGTISSSGKIASLTIGPAAPALPTPQLLVQGGSGSYSGSIVSQGSIGPVIVTGSIEGGGGSFSGAIVARDLITAFGESAGDMGSVLISGHVAGGSGPDSGEIHADGNLVGATTGDLTASSGSQSGSIRTGQGFVHPGTTGAIRINGVLNGSIITEGRFASVTVTGNVTGGEIRSGNDIGSLTFLKNVDGLEVSARGQVIQGAASDLAIGTITALGHVGTSQFLAGYDTAGQAQNPDAQIGAVSVTGDWTASDLVAGVVAGSQMGFGTASEAPISGHDNAKIISQIASILIGGTVSGTAAAGDEFGFTAEKIGSFHSKAGSKPFNAVADGQEFDIATDVAAREVPLPV